VTLLESPPLPILLHHSVSDTPSASVRDYAVSPATFGRHLDTIAESGASTLTVSDLHDVLDSGCPLPERPVVVTFDDGCLDTLTAAPCSPVSGWRQSPPSSPDPSAGSARAATR
jgi:hypothetical protein